MLNSSLESTNRQELQLIYFLTAALFSVTCKRAATS